jgi:hypothetical protein
LSWSELDQDKAIAWQNEQRSVCSGCGTRSDEWLDVDGRDVDPPPYEIHTKKCLGCESIEEFKTNREVQENGRGLYIALRPYVGNEEEQ